jgi:transcriptional regulator GlxA family with amidase domain
MLLVPGGIGTRREVENEELLDFLRSHSAEADLVMSVCTGAGLLPRAGLLDGRRATTNKQVFEWPVSQGPRVNWIRQARWVEDGKFVTSSGISAGIDMALAVISHRYGEEIAEAIALAMEYEWHRDPLRDPFPEIARR